MKWEDRQRMIAELEKIWKHQNGLAAKYGKLCIHPDDSEEYRMNKTLFDAASHLAAQTEAEKARLILGESKSPSIFDKLLQKMDKLIKDEDDWKKRRTDVLGVRG
ncbi:MAG: hypothetical protein ACTSUB_00670 [Candidatus Thorarchaeota archaeon]